MSGTKIINNIYNYDETYEPETISKEYLEIGYLSIEFTNMGTTLEKKLKENSVVDLNGNVYIFDIAPGGDEEIEGTLPSDGDVYARFYEDAGVAKIEWTTDALPDFDYHKKGYYASNKRFVFHAFMYDDIMIREEVILNSYIVEQKAWENRSAIADKLSQASKWHPRFLKPSAAWSLTGMGYISEPFNKMYSYFRGDYPDYFSHSYLSDDGINWTYGRQIDDNMKGIPVPSPTLNLAVLASYDTDTTSASMYSSDLINWTDGPTVAIASDRLNYGYTSTNTDELLGWSAAWCLGVGCQGAPGYDSSKGRILFNEYNYDTYFYASDGAAGDEYGYSIASVVDADPSTADELFLIGAPGNNAAYQVYYNNAGSITEQAIITPPSSFSGDRFGHAVGFTTNYKVVGAPGANKAYVFLNNVYQATLTGSNNFGSSVGIHGDYIIVGSDVDAIIYLRSGTSWNVQQTISYGCSAVSINGSNVIIGDANNSEVKLYTRSGSTWSLSHTITESGDFGTSVVIVDELYWVGAPSIDKVYQYRVSDNFNMQVLSPIGATYTWFASGITGVEFGRGLGVFHYEYSGSDNYQIAVGDPASGVGGKTEYYLQNYIGTGNVAYIVPQGWNPDLEEFYATCFIGDGSSHDNGTFFMSSLDGHEWTVKNRIIYIDNNNPIGLGIIWNGREQKYVAWHGFSGNGGGGSFSSIDGGYYWSYDGTWTGLTTRQNSIGWAEELGLYYFLGNNGNNSATMTEMYTYVSADNISWTQTNMTVENTTAWSRMNWIPELKIFIVSAYGWYVTPDPYNLMYSHDGYNWTTIKGTSVDGIPSYINYIPSTGTVIIQSRIDSSDNTTLVNK